ncbi:MAG: hypothetical protein IT355_00460 [Gemmatimonadaceae bacterium]|nr:hypothetical protein [Gemmatimonadaceae bacterium]
MKSRALGAVAATIALSLPVAAQRGDSTAILPEIRSASWIAGAPGVLHRAFVGDLQVALVLQSDDGTTTPLTKADVTRMRLTEARAFVNAIRNLRAKLTPYSDDIPDPSPELSGMYPTEGASIVTSRLLLQDDWRAIESRLGGPIVAVAPMTGSLIFGRDTIVPLSRRKSAPAAQFLELAAGVLIPYGKREDALGTTVLRFTPTGWRVVPPMTEAERRDLNRQPAEGADGAADQTARTSVTPPAVLPPSADPVPPPRPSKPVTKPAKP